MWSRASACFYRTAALTWSRPPRGWSRTEGPLHEIPAQTPGRRTPPQPVALLLGRGGGRRPAAPFDDDPGPRRLGYRPRHRDRRGALTGRGPGRAGRPGQPAPDPATGARYGRHDAVRPRGPGGGAGGDVPALGGLSLLTPARAAQIRIVRAEKQSLPPGPDRLCACQLQCL